MSILAWPPRLFRAGMGFVYPHVCLWCERLLEGDTVEDQSLCAKCERLLAPGIPHRCQRCSAPVGPHLETSRGCVHCGRDPMHYQNVVSLGPYENELRIACLKCKKPGHQALVQSLSELLCQRESIALQDWQADLVIPVPHHWRDRIWSGHASDLVAQRLGGFLKQPVERHILLKVKRTPKQLMLSASARRENLRSSFRVSGSVRLEGCKVLLADDILTTGTTAERCTQTLLKAGAASVNVAVLARGIGA